LVTSTTAGKNDVWIYEWGAILFTRLTFDPANDAARMTPVLAAASSFGIDARQRVANL